MIQLVVLIVMFVCCQFGSTNSPIVCIEVYLYINTHTTQMEASPILILYQHSTLQLSVR